MGFKINFPAEFKNDAAMAAKRAAAKPIIHEHAPAQPTPTDKPHFAIIGGEFFNVTSAVL